MEEDGGEGGGHTKYSPCVYLASEGGGGGGGGDGGEGRTHNTWLSNTLNALKVLFQLINSFDVTR